MSYRYKSVRDFFNFRPIFHDTANASLVLCPQILASGRWIQCVSGITFPFSSKKCYQHDEEAYDKAQNTLRRCKRTHAAASCACFNEVAPCENRGPEAMQTWICVWPRRKKEVTRLQHFPEKRVGKKTKTSSEVKFSHWHQHGAKT